MGEPRNAWDEGYAEGYRAGIAARPSDETYTEVERLDRPGNRANGVRATRLANQPEPARGAEPGSFGKRNLHPDDGYTYSGCNGPACRAAARPSDEVTPAVWNIDADGVAHSGEWWDGYRAAQSARPSDEVTGLREAARNLIAAWPNIMNHPRMHGSEIDALRAALANTKEPDGE